MKFSDASTARPYSDREVDPTWIQWCTEQLEPEGRDVIDIGCGGGIYTAGFLRCGARSIAEARKACPAATFRVASCYVTGLEPASADLIFERAGFHNVIATSHIETTRVYNSRDELAAELLERKGRSILYELSDNELREYVDSILAISPDTNIQECDRWTIWQATKRASTTTTGSWACCPPTARGGSPTQ